MSSYSFNLLKQAVPEFDAYLNCQSADEVIDSIKDQNPKNANSILLGFARKITLSGQGVLTRII